MVLNSLTALINGLLPEPQAGLLNGMLFGVKTTLDVSVKNSLTNSGTIYILAHSGLTISVLVSMVNLVLLRFVRRPIANLASALVIIGFIWLVGPSPSVMRAGIMATISLLSVSFGRQNWPLLAWILAVICMLLLNPSWIGNLSFQVSTMATLGIIMFGKKKTPKVATPSESIPADYLSHLGNLGNVINVLWKLVEDSLRITFAAQVFTIPIIMFQFGRISLVSPLSNILIGWTIAPIMVIGFIMVTVGFVWMPLATAIAWVMWVPLTFVIMIIEWTAKLPFASISF